MILTKLMETKIPESKNSVTEMMQPHEKKVQKIKVINITEEGRYGGPQSRITKVAYFLKDKRVETTVIFVFNFCVHLLPKNFQNSWFVYYC